MKQFIAGKNEAGQRFWSKATATVADCQTALTATSNWDGR